MQRVVIAKTQRFTLTSYGNGLAYALDRKGHQPVVFVQGDDASQFRFEFDALEDIKPSTEATLAELWHQYAPEVRVRCNACMTVMLEWAGRTITQCVNCGRDDALMQPFVPSSDDKQEQGT